MASDPHLAAVVEALRRRDATAAVSRLQAVPDAPPMLRAQVCALAGDAAGEEAALMAVLKAEPRNMAALIAMGERKAADGDERTASLWFRTALNQAAVTPPPPAARPLMEKAAAYVQGASGRFATHLAAALGDAARLPRIAQAIDLLAGRTEIYPQRPSQFHFPGLAPRCFFERGDFPWLADVEAAIPAMRDELLAAGDAAFSPYVETPKDSPAPNNPLRDDPRWSAGWLWRQGAVVRDAPATLAALARAPMPMIGGRSPNALWSRLAPGTHIAPHHGLLNTRLICHVPLITAPDCGLRVGHETRGWEEGESLIFDDSIEHEAWNRGGSPRTILLFEIWRPDIEAAERAALTTLFRSIDGFGAAAAL